MTGEELLNDASARLEALPYLYKYVSLSGDRMTWFANAIAEPYLYFCPASRLNDPFEGRVPFDFGAPGEAIRKYWVARGYSGAALDDLVASGADPAKRKKLQAIVEHAVAESGVCCLAERADDIPMWAYYGDGHAGLCLQYDTRRLLAEFMTPQRALLLPVQYHATYPRVAFYEADDTVRAWTLLASKALPWEHEREWRLVSQSVTGPVACSPALLSGVVMGCRISPENREAVKALAARRKPPLAVRQARAHNSDYVLEILDA